MPLRVWNLQNLSTMHINNFKVNGRQRRTGYAGTVSLTGKGYAGGVVGEFSDGSCNYNVGKVTAKGKYAMAGEIAGYVSGENTVSDNYYTGSGKKSGREYTSWVPYQSKAKKVSSITSANCPKLSSKYWTYSSKHKRLILKNNKEA